MDERAPTTVLLVNLGTPESPTPAAIRRWLREFLSDPRVVELPRLLWFPVLYGFILPLRPRKLARAYGQVWTAQGSPLLAISRRQRDALQAQLGADFRVVLAMRYGAPSLGDALAAVPANGRVIVLPLYPQYSATTTASVLDAVFAALGQRRHLPSLTTINDYFDAPAYIEALAASVEDHWRRNGRGEHLVISLHSIPQKCVDAGDPYGSQCETTARLLAQRLDLAASQWTLAYQSRIGRMAWLQPYTDEVLDALAQRKLPRVDVVCPGFAADCLETLEEIGIRYAKRFAQSGGTLRCVPALNDSPLHVAALANLVRQHVTQS
jgi:ferrochelatase